MDDMYFGEDTPTGVRVQVPFVSCSFGFVLFNHPDGKYELCMADAASKQIFLNIGTFDNVEQVHQEYKEFVNTFTAAMRMLEWND